PKPHNPCNPPLSSPFSFFFLLTPQPPSSTLFPYTTLFRSEISPSNRMPSKAAASASLFPPPASQSRISRRRAMSRARPAQKSSRSEEHTSELQSQSNLVCRLLLEKKKTLTK